GDVAHHQMKRTSPFERFRAPIQDRAALRKKAIEEKMDSTVYGTKNGNSWDSDYMERYEYDFIGHLTLTTGLEINQAGTGWDSSYKTEYTYTGTGATLEELESYWNESTMQWDLSNKTV